MLERVLDVLETNSTLGDVRCMVHQCIMVRRSLSGIEGLDFLLAAVDAVGCSGCVLNFLVA